jgi:hypothetical protein
MEREKLIKALACAKPGSAEYLAILLALSVLQLLATGVIVVAEETDRPGIEVPAPPEPTVVHEAAELEEDAPEEEIPEHEEADTPAPQPSASKPKKPLAIEKLRKAMADAITAGHDAKALLTGRGYSKLSEVPEDIRQDIYDEVKELVKANG